jgi:TolB protein
MPSWSSDGRWLAFTSNRDQGFDIYIIRADGSDLIRLTEGSATADYNPVWRPR